MTILYPELIVLNQLQAQFEDVACDDTVPVFRKAKDMADVLEGIGQMLEDVKLSSSHILGDVADHILDFIARDDLSAKWIDRAFPEEDAQNKAFRSRLEHRLGDLMHAADEYDRTKQEGFVLPPEQLL